MSGNTKVTRLANLQLFYSPKGEWILPVENGTEALTINYKSKTKILGMKLDMIENSGIHISELKI